MRRPGGAVSIASRGSASSELGGIFAEDVFAKVKLVQRSRGDRTTTWTTSAVGGGDNSSRVADWI